MEGRVPFEIRIKRRSVVSSTGCLLWTGRKDSCGYGVMKVGPHSLGAHKVSALLSGAVIPEGMVVMHSCDTPACMNPEHLSVGTQAQNIKDCVNKGRHSRAGRVLWSNRKDALLAGAVTYEGSLCKVHGICTRKTNNGACVECAEDYRRTKNELRRQSRKG